MSAVWTKTSNSHRRGSQDNRLAFLDCCVKIEENGSLSITVYRKSTHTDQYLMFDSHHPLIHKLGVIRTLFRCADNIQSTEESKSREREHLKSALTICGYQNWTHLKKPWNPGRNLLQHLQLLQPSQANGAITSPSCMLQVCQRNWNKFLANNRSLPLSNLVILWDRDLCIQKTNPPVGRGDNLQLFISPLLKYEGWLYNIIDDKNFEINSLEPPCTGGLKIPHTPMENYRNAKNENFEFCFNCSKCVPVN